MAKTIVAAFDRGPRMHNEILLDALRDAARQVEPDIGEPVRIIVLEGHTGQTDSGRAAISGAHAVVADLSTTDPAVFLEIGRALALAQPLVLLAGEPDSVPGSLRDLPIVLYERVSIMKIRAPRLSEALRHSLGSPSDRTRRPVTSAATVVVSYSHKDVTYLNRVLVHLRPLEHAQLVDAWSDTRLAPGDDWRDEIRAALDRARIAVLLVSADYLASDFIATNELPPLLDAAHGRGTKIVPVIIKPSRFERDSRLNRFHALNDPKVPIIRMSESEAEEVYARLADMVELVVGFQL